MRSAITRLSAICLAVVAASVGVAMWRSSPAAASTPPPAVVPAGPPATAQVIRGLTVDVRAGVKFVVPPRFAYQKLDDGTLSVGDARGIRLVVGVATGARLAQLDEPRQGARNYAKDNSLDLVSLELVELDPLRQRTVARLVDPKSGALHELIIFTAPKVRAVVFVIVPKALVSEPATTQLLVELRDQRLVLP